MQDETVGVPFHALGARGRVADGHLKLLATETLPFILVALVLNSANAQEGRECGVSNVSMGRTARLPTYASVAAPAWHNASNHGMAAQFGNVRSK
jgi:hypothetical protein